MFKALMVTIGNKCANCNNPIHFNMDGEIKQCKKCGRYNKYYEDPWSTISFNALTVKNAFEDKI